MRKHSDFVDLSYAMFNESAKRGIMYHTAENERLDGRLIQVGGAPWVNFGSCSYLGLETNGRLKEGVIDAVTRYGSQFSSSRAMVSAPPYAELEELLGRIFGATVLMCPSTSLGHIAALPMLIAEDDLLVMDQQVHWSVSTAATQCQAHGTKVEVIRHNSLEQLEELIRKHRTTKRKIWYLADGLYSMYGDYPPIPELLALQARYEQLHLYFDDAHAMSWCGQHGRGHVLSELALGDRVVVATSLNKAFAAAGGVLLMSDDLIRRKLRVVGGPLIYSGPIQPPMLGAALASARIHLAADFGALQSELHERVRYVNRLARERGLPMLTDSDAPIRFVGTGLPRVTYNMVERLQGEGFYLNVAVFPVVPMRRAGLRFTITRQQTLEDLRGLMDAMAYHLPLALAEEGSSLEQVFEAFGLPFPENAASTRYEPLLELTSCVVHATPALSLEHHDTIATVDAQLWDTLLGAHGTFTALGLRLLESTFTGNALPEDNWRFHYYVVRAADGTPVLATFATEALWKDDMVASRSVSTEVERRRAGDAYFLTSRTLALGALLTEGQHLYLDRSRDWRGALALLLQALVDEQRRSGANMIVLRDLPSDDGEMDAFLLEQGFAKLPMPDSLVLDASWANDEAYLVDLSQRSRRFLKREVLPREADFEVEILTKGGRSVGKDELAYLHQLYSNVKARNVDFNTFELPARLFEHLLDESCWELVLLRLPTAAGGPEDGRPVACLASFIGPEQYVPLIVGLDYNYVYEHGAYRQCILQAVRRARHHGLERIYFGMGATLEKQRFGARARAQSSYFQAIDHYNLDRLAQLMAGVGS